MATAVASVLRAASAATRVFRLIGVLATRVAYTASEPATVRFEIVRRLAARRTRVAGVLTRKTGGGRHSLVFTGRVGKRKLVPGLYRLRASAIDLAGNHSRVATVAFTVTRR